MGKQITKCLNFWISCQKSNISNKPKYVGIQIEQNLEQNVHIKNVIVNFNLKLNRVIGTLSKIRHCVPKLLFKKIYNSFLNSHLIYACQVWDQNKKYP